jgi:dTDP-4-amino-4,6-dideoxygalactose transaminase
MFVRREMTVRHAMEVLDRSGSQLLLLVDEEQRFLRTITDGDLRRLLLTRGDLDQKLNSLPMIASVTGTETISRREALALLDEHLINQLPILDAASRPVRLVDRREIGKQILLSTPHMGEAELHFIEEAFRTNWIAPLGPNVDAFERDVASLVGVGHAAALSSGTAAIHLGVRLLGAGRGDRVFCSTLTFAASANPIVYEGAEPVFIDSEPESWNMSPKALERAFDVARAEGWLPKAVIVVNLYGQSADMDPILEICDYHGVPVIEDAAESMGARYKGRPSGSMGRLGVFSFNGNKIITTSGGGMLVSDDAELIGRARFLATQARDPAPHYEHTEIGYNYRMSNLLAGVGRGQLQVLEDRVKARRAVFDAYVQGLSGISSVEWMAEPEWSYSNRWLTTCTIAPGAGKTASDVIRHLADEMIEARPVWKPMHLQPVFAGVRYFPHGNESISDDLFARGVCLPSGSNMTRSEIDRTIDTLARYLA